MTAKKTDPQRPSTTAILRQLYWTVRKNPSAGRHVATAITRSARLTASMALRRRNRRPVALALVEHMGDIVAAEPIARMARSRFPNDRIAWISRAPYRCIPESHADVDETIVVGCLTEWLLAWSLGAFDVVWDMHLSGRDCPTCRASFTKPGNRGEVTYQTYYDKGSLLSTQCQAAGIETLTTGPCLDPGSAARQAVDAIGLPDKYVVVHAKSNEATRDWTPAGWAALLDHLSATYPGEVIEIGTTTTAMTKQRNRTRSLCGMLNILETAELIRRAEAFIGIDSGPAQIANAVGTRGIVLMGDYNSFRGQMPYSGGYADGTNATILRAKGPAANLTADQVIAAVNAAIVRPTAVASP